MLYKLYKFERKVRIFAPCSERCSNNIQILLDDHFWYLEKAGLTHISYAIGIFELDFGYDAGISL